jgi:Cu2+-exporting ATPase
MDKSHKHHVNAERHDHPEKHDQPAEHNHSARKNTSHEAHKNGLKDHSGHHGVMIKEFRRRFWLSLIFTLPILILSPMIQDLLGFRFTLLGAPDKYILFALSTVVFFYGGWPFLTGLVVEVKKKQPGMMTLIAVAITVAWGYSSATTFGVKGSTFFWELATLIDIMLLGHWIEMKSILGASKSLQMLVEMMPDEAHLVKNGGTEDVKVDQLKKDDLVLVRPGEKIPVDGVVVEGESNVNEAMITGESKPVVKGKDDRVTGGSLNGNGSLTVSVRQVGEEAYLSKVINMVRDAQDKKSKTQNLADRIAFWLTVIALSVGFGTLAAWLLIGKPFVFALERMATVMVIACPHALGLAVPLVVAISTSVAAQHGLLIRNRTAFENSRKISVMIFDKTGTLTMGNFGVTRYGSFVETYNDTQILSLAGALEAKSEHPLAMGIMQKIKDEKIEIPSESYINEAETVVFVVVDDKLTGFIAMSDEIRKESYEAVKMLKEHGLKLFMITGDNEKVAKSVSDALGLDGWYAGILPDGKLKKVKEFQKKGEFVAMTGDGVNDAPALAAADVGIAIGSGTDIAAETADIILVNSNPQDIASLVIFGKATYNKMIQNFIWATGYNVVAIPLAAGVLFSAGIIISPAIGAVFMSVSTVIVAINAQFLKRKMRKI